MKQVIAVVVSATLVAGCANSLSRAGLPATPGENVSNFGYVPLDPLPINETNACSPAPGGSVPLLSALPDLAIRFAIGSFDSSGSISYGPAKVTAARQAYRAVLDYVNVDGVPVNFQIRKLIRLASGEIKQVTLAYKPRGDEEIAGYEAITATDSPSRGGQGPDRADLTSNLQEGFTTVTVPIYIGIGLRLSADIRALKGGINLSGLGVIGAAAEADTLSGTLTVQTLGINGKAIATILPLPSKLDQTTIENGILALGGSRATLYAATAGDGAVTTIPRVVGLYSPIGSDPMLINALYSELAKVRPVWTRPCAPASPA